MTAVQRVSALIQARQFDRAVQEAGAALATDPDSPRMWHMLALAEFGRSNSPAALPAIERVLAADEGRADVFHTHGMILTALTRYGDAIDAYLRALAVDPDHASSHRHLAKVLIAGGEETPQDVRKRALGHARRARELTPDDAESHLTMASVLLELPGNQGRAAAAEAIRAALELDPSNTDALRMEARVQHRTVRAVRLYADILALDPQDAAAATSLAVTTWVLFARMHLVVVGMVLGAWLGGFVATLLEGGSAVVLRVVLAVAVAAVMWFVLLGRPASAFPQPMRRAALVLIRRDELLRPHTRAIAWAGLGSLAAVAVPWPHQAGVHLCVLIGLVGYAAGVQIARRRLHVMSDRVDAKRRDAWLAVAASVRRP